MAAVTAATKLERRNWLIHQMYVRRSFEDCLSLIEQQLHATRGLSEYALYVKGLILRQQGAIQESLQLFQAATFLNPKSAANLKQVARSLYLMGKHKAAVDVYTEVAALPDGDEDWEVHHAQGMCQVYLQRYEEALEAFEAANSIQRHESTFLAMSNVAAVQGNLEEAVGILEEALEFTPDSSDILTQLGLLHLRLGDNLKAFEFLGSSLTHDPRGFKTILAAGSIIQDHQEYDVALSKYRVAAAASPHSPHLWNNIAMCFFGKAKYVAAIACLKRAHYLDPFEWIVAYNLGLAHLTTGQYASAFTNLSACVNLSKGVAAPYTLLGITLSRLGDAPNAVLAYAQASKYAPKDPYPRLNAALSAYNREDDAEARAQAGIFDSLWEGLDPEARQEEEGWAEARLKLGSALGLSPPPSLASRGGGRARAESSVGEGKA